MAYPISKQIIIPWLQSRVISFSGLDNVPHDTPILFVANHVGYHDPLLIQSLIVPHLNKKVYAITKWFIFRIPIFSRWAGAIPLFHDRKKTYAKALEILQKGECVLIYPEGSVNRSDVIGTVKTGAARLALAAKIPVIPIGVMRASNQVQSKIARYAEIFFGKLLVMIGKRIDISPYYGSEINRPLLDEVTKTIMSEVAKLSGKRYMGNA